MRILQHRIGVALIILLTVTACSRYSVSINENLIYHPPGLFKNYALSDQGLQKCVQDSIAELWLTKAEQLLRLFCPAGEIGDLSGIQVFQKLEYLGLAGNHIKNLDPLAALKFLKQVNVADNQVEDFSPLSGLVHLQFVNARGNAAVSCASFNHIEAKVQIVKPEHCLSR